MFTGIIKAVGRIRTLEPRGGDLRVAIDAGKLDLSDTRLGDSIAVSGVCLTVVTLDGASFAADVSRETLTRTTLGDKTVGSRVNLEPALRIGEALGGHLVSGHVDGVGTVVEVKAEARSQRLTFEVPAHLARYIAEKGSITVDGVSLTVNHVEGARFSVNIVPHTLAETTLDECRSRAPVNLEVDLIARYLERLLLGARAATPGTRISAEFLAEHGFIK